MKRLWAWPWAWMVLMLLLVEDPGHTAAWRFLLAGIPLGRAVYLFERRGDSRCTARHVDPYGWEHHCSLHRGHDGRRHLADGEDFLDLYQWPTREAFR